MHDRYAKCLIKFMEGDQAGYLIRDQIPSYSFLTKKVQKNLTDYQNKRGRYRGYNRGNNRFSSYQPNRRFQNFNNGSSNSSHLEGLVSQLLQQQVQGPSTSSGFWGGRGSYGNGSYGIDAQKKVSRCAHCDVAGHWVSFIAVLWFFVIGLF